MVSTINKKIAVGEVLALKRELEAFAGPAPKLRGCEICRNGDQNAVKVARDNGYKAQTIADFLNTTRGYEINDGAVYRHLYRCEKRD
jgi:hypothetical protein